MVGNKIENVPDNHAVLDLGAFNSLAMVPCLLGPTTSGICVLVCKPAWTKEQLDGFSADNGDSYVQHLLDEIQQQINTLRHVYRNGPGGRKSDDR